MPLKVFVFAVITATVIISTIYYRQAHSMEVQFTFADCPPDLVDNDGTCYFRIRNLEYFDSVAMCKHCKVDIVRVNGRWVHETYPSMRGGFISCLDHQYKHAMVEQTTVAEPAYELDELDDAK